MCGLLFSMDYKLRCHLPNLISFRFQIMTSITKPFLEGILKSPVESFSVRPGTNAGDNFTSLIHSIQVYLEGQVSPLDLVIKTYPLHPARQEFLDDNGIFEKELLVYNTFIPALKAFIAKACASECIEELKLPFAPLVHGHVVEKSEDPLGNYLLMVDARKTWGYQMANRSKGLDFSHCQNVFKELAKLHATSWAFKVVNNLTNLKEKFPFLNEKLFGPENYPLIKVMTTQAYNSIGSLVEASLGEESVVVQGYRKFMAGANRTFSIYNNDKGQVDEIEAESLFRIKPNTHPSLSSEPWRVVNHGDCWSNNILFLYDDKNKEANDPTDPKGIMFVDLQMVRDTCPTVDLAYFVYTSTTHTLRANHLDTLLEMYSAHFLYFCEILGVKPLPGFSIEELRRRFHRTKPFGLVLASLALPIILSAPEQIKDFDTIEIGNETYEGEKVTSKLGELFSAAIFKNAKCQNKLIEGRIVSLVKEMYDDGII